MKYIRTKDGVFELVDTYYVCVNGVETYMYNDNGRGVEIKGNQILKQADTIEELCDEFRYEYDEYYKNARCLKNDDTGKWYDWYDDEDEDALIFELKEKEIATIKGAIWTDKGLIYVAKMNKDGDFELL